MKISSIKVLTAVLVIHPPISPPSPYWARGYYPEHCHARDLWRITQRGTQTKVVCVIPSEQKEQRARLSHEHPRFESWPWQFYDWKPHKMATPCRCFSLRVGRDRKNRRGPHCQVPWQWPPSNQYLHSYVWNACDVVLFGTLLTLALSLPSCKWPGMTRNKVLSALKHLS